jgi:adenylate cyclase
VGQEIERKFRVHGEAWRDEVAHTTRIRQGYLHRDDHAEVRVRVRDDRATLTVKRGGAGLERQEVEVGIEVAAAQRLLAEACVGSVVEKHRHEVPIGDLLVEVDEFEGRLAGLVLAEVELSDPAASVPVRPWLGDEVTGDRRYYNAALTDDEPDVSNDGAPTSRR